MLRGRPQLWEALEEREGVFVRRIEQGISAVGERRSRYSAYATFGGTDAEVSRELSHPQDGSKFQDELSLLAGACSDMFKWMKAVRDSAVWRVVDSAHAINAELQIADAGNGLPWQAVTADEGALAFLKELGWDAEWFAELVQDTGSGCNPTDEEIEDTALEVIGRLEQVAGLAADVRDFFRQGRAEEPGSAAGFAPGAAAADAAERALGEVVETIVQVVKGMNEDLLCLMDDPNKPSAEAWLALWSCCFSGSSPTGQQFEVAMASLPLKRDAELGGKQRQERQRWLALARGLQIFLSDEAMRSLAVSPLSLIVRPAEANVPRRREFALVTLPDDLELAVPSAPVISASRPSSGVPGRRQSFQVPNKGPPAELPKEENAGPASTTASPSAGAKIRWRPDTPSTTADDGTQPIRSTPTAKFIGGQYMSVRPNSPQIRLPPLSPKTWKPS